MNFVKNSSNSFCRRRRKETLKSSSPRHGVSLRRLLQGNGAGNAGGFTLAEVLAALLFMAIVIPMAVQALRIASLAGEVAQRKGEAARVAERILNESVVTTNWNQTSQTGTLIEGSLEFRWTLHSTVWAQGSTNANGTAAS